MLVGAYSYASGDVLLAPSVPVKEGETSLNTGIVGYLQTVSLFGRSANLLVELPYSWGTARGVLDGLPVKRDFSALGDVGLSVNINLRGEPSMNREEFQLFRADPQPLIGLGFKVVAPTGHYDDSRLVNVGTNRWAARLKLGSVVPLKSSWIWEISANTWWYQDDDDYVNGRKEQDPFFALESSLIKRIRPGLWASLDMTYYRGGNQTIDGNSLDNRQKNLRLGGTFVWPFARRHAIKVGYANGVVTRYGADFNGFLLSYQVVL